MAAEKNESRAANSMTEDVKEYVELLKKLNDSEKEQVKGVMIGLQMARESRVQIA